MRIDGACIFMCRASQELRRLVENKSAHEQARARGYTSGCRGGLSSAANLARVTTAPLQPLPTIRGDFRRRVSRLNLGIHLLQAGSKCVDLLLLLRHGCLQFLDLAMFLE